MVEKSRVAEEDGRADGEEGEPATRPGDQEEEQEEKEENASHHHLPMSYKPVKPGKQDLDAQKDHTKKTLKNSPSSSCSLVPCSSSTSLPSQSHCIQTYYRNSKD